MEITITDYESLLTVAKQQAEPQRMLFVFLKSSLPKDHDDTEATSFNAGQGGALQPIMCVDKTLDELGSFEDLVTESKQMEQEWQIVLIAGLSGKNGVAPTSVEAQQPLETMVNNVHNGGDLTRYIAFDRQGSPVHFG